tara:strand:+ start:289 stop:624 length:336 start_codon:yes stop_codon:yes gene_type:complete
MTSILTITKNAGQQLQRIAKHHNVSSILFSVKGGGCNGFNYNFIPLKESLEDHKEKVIYENIEIIICNSSLFHLLGTKIDWTSSLMGDAFKFDNPNASGKCGCGTSFSMDK